MGSSITQPGLGPTAEPAGGRIEYAVVDLHEGARPRILRAGRRPFRATLENDFMQDAHTTVAQLKVLVANFVNERQWAQFHTPKNLCMSLAIEAAELMEHFQWLTPEASHAVKHDAAKRGAVGEELADVVSYALALANELDLDLAAAVADKMRKNAVKYPAHEYRGRYGKDDV